MAHANLCWDWHLEMFISHWLWKLRYDIWACQRWFLGSLKGLTKFENSHGELYSFVHKKWWLFDQLEFRLPLAERSSYLLMITTESHLGVLIRNSTLMKGAAWHFSGTALKMLAILSPIKLKNWWIIHTNTCLTVVCLLPVKCL